MIDRQPLLFLNGVALAALGGAMLLPAVTDLIEHAPDARVFFFAAGITLAVGGLFITASGGFGTRFNRKSSFLAAVSLWLTLPLFAALPFTFSALRLSYVDGVFEAISGLTTTGLTTITGLDDAPRGILLWRALLNWIGGIGFSAMAIVLLPFLQIGGMQLFRAESARSESAMPGARQTAIAILIVYVALDVACGLAYWFGGMSAFDAICHAMSTVSTGGFSTHDASFGYFHTPMVFWSAVVFMLCGALPFVLFLRLARGEISALWRDTQVVTLIALVAAATALIVASLFSPDRPVQTLVPDALFNVVSIVTTSGFATTDYAHWGTLSAAVFLFLTFHGGCAGSTAGGIKTMRFEVLVRQTYTQIRRLVLPHSVTTVHYAGRSLTPEIASSVASFALLYFITVFLVAFGLGLLGADFLTALTAAASAVGNVGPGLGGLVGDVAPYTAFGAPEKILLALGMLAGRLELLTVLVLFTVTFWRS